MLMHAYKKRKKITSQVVALIELYIRSHSIRACTYGAIVFCTMNVYSYILLVFFFEPCMPCVE